MNKAITAFHDLIKQLETTDGLFNYLQTQKVPIDASDLLRWEWVLAVSALDKYIHDIIRVGMLQTFQGKRLKTDKYNTFRIDMIRYNNLLTSLTPDIVFEQEIIRQHSYMAFQHPDKMVDALSYIWSEQHKWEAISNNMVTPITAKNVKTKLNNIVIRRDQIVHEGDCFTLAPPLQKQIITQTDVHEVVSFIIELVDAIQKCVI